MYPNGLTDLTEMFETKISCVTDDAWSPFCELEPSTFKENLRFSKDFRTSMDLYSKEWSDLEVIDGEIILALNFNKGPNWYLVSLFKLKMVFGYKVP